ncbi:cysteine desufuration protein SufE [Rhizobium rhizosphaerae]|uniref:Cysteine desufuration protein SufE n=1 Tax=Xaviernesmea rhizosphaerae TaxID=1672749 RepID=A0A1Q9ADQ6_9HYPH|nr:SufE family protein [Xaviernesmea rhizosphaerae]OLP53048.1 cysteine desufuration protein SufE [Xaviernesmea rhizosphaerae]
MTQPASVPPLADILENCAFLDDWQDRMSYVIELGRGLPPLPEADRTAENKVQGCASQVWLVSRAEPSGDAGDPVLHFKGESDAHIVRGLVAIVLAIYSGKRASEILATDALALFSQMGLIEFLTAQRANGLRSMVNRIKAEAAAAQAA